MASAIPKSTQNKSKWATGIFEDWRRARFPKVATLEPGGLFKHYDLHKAQSLEVLLVQMDALSLKYWLTKFIQEVAKPSRERYPPKRYTRLCVEYVVSSRKRKRSWILILPMLRTKGAVVLLYVALVIIYSDILIVQLYLGYLYILCGFSIFRRVLGAQIHVPVLRYEYVNKETFYSWVWNLFQALVVFNSFFIGFLNSSTWPEWGVLGW